MTTDQDKDVLAAEYVLGTLGPQERAEAQARIATDSSFADTVRRWERRLGELSAMVDPVEPPPDMWDRIKAGMAASQAGAPESVAEAVAVAEAVRPPADAPAVASKTDPSAQPTADAMTASRVEAAKEASGAAPEVHVTAVPEGPAAPEVPFKAAPVKESAEPAVLQRPAAPTGVIPRVPAAPPFEASAASPSGEARGRIVSLSGSRRRWRFATVALGALAACLLVLVVVQTADPDRLPVALQPKAKVVEVTRTVEVPSPKPAEFVAVLQKDAASPAFLLTFDLEKRMLTVRTVGAERQAGKSYELWLISDKFPAPRSLGVIGGASYTVRPTEPDYDAVVVNRATYAVSLEPEGGSPTGTPTGPVLYSGRLLEATAPDFPARAP